MLRRAAALPAVRPAARRAAQRCVPPAAPARRNATFIVFIASHALFPRTNPRRCYKLKATATSTAPPHGSASVPGVFRGEQTRPNAGPNCGTKHRGTAWNPAGGSCHEGHGRESAGSAAPRHRMAQYGTANYGTAQPGTVLTRPAPPPQLQRRSRPPPPSRLPLT